ncbi:MAG: polymer-forming cytoskeletal protein [Treponema sp.]|jgi:cytoskeletal protein CcmA (bactofilin family)|nr:polymer-forming cytoskeletal protein [Treponema sp.]
MPQEKSGDFSINTIIGPNTDLTGDIETNGFTRIDGFIRGNVKAKGRVVIGERARMKGNVSGTNITIGGVVCGNVVADGHLVILSSAVVIGDIITRRIQADDGSFINGRVAVCPNDERWAKVTSEYRDAQGIKSALPVFNRTYG